MLSLKVQSLESMSHKSLYFHWVDLTFFYEHSATKFDQVVIVHFTFTYFLIFTVHTSLYWYDCHRLLSTVLFKRFDFMTIHLHDLCFTLVHFHSLALIKTHLHINCFIFSVNVKFESWKIRLKSRNHCFLVLLSTYFYVCAEQHILLTASVYDRSVVNPAEGIVVPEVWVFLLNPLCSWWYARDINMSLPYSYISGKPASAEYQKNTVG